MSYIETELDGKPEDSHIIGFLLAEGFEEDKDTSGNHKLSYSKCGPLYCVTITYQDQDYDDKPHLYVYVDYDVGGLVNEKSYFYDRDDFESFMESYKEAVEFAKHFVKST